MNITIIGVGYVGLVTGTCLADLGHQVVCLDRHPDRVASLKKGKVHFYEPGLADLVKKNVEEKRLDFTVDVKKAFGEAQVFFICVGTPPKENGEADLSAVYKVAQQIGDNLKHYAVVVDKSTVPVGTAEKVKEIISERYKREFDVVSNPEFLREGSAVGDFKNPDRVVVGAESDKAKKMMQELYNDYKCPIVVTGVKSAEMIKYASNAFLANKISFINEIANVCELVNANVEDVAYGMGLDQRIGEHFLRAGLGYGGSCFPKDVRALDQIAGFHNYNFYLLKAIIEVNHEQRVRFVDKVVKELGEVKGKQIGAWGLAFKPDTDDTRESAAIWVLNRLEEMGAKIKAYDPEAMENTKKELPDIEYCDNPLEAIKDADCLLLLTEWDEFKNPDFENLGKLMKNKLIIDGRNVFAHQELRGTGFKYISMGRN